MCLFRSILFFIWGLFSTVSCFLVVGSIAGCPHEYYKQTNKKFEKKTDRFWEFNEETRKWIEVELPYDLITCVDNNCTKVGTIDQAPKDQKEGLDQVNKQSENSKRKDGDKDGTEKEDSEKVVLPRRKRMSLTKMSDMSIWVTGESGSIYERFWNGVQWVIAPHDLPISTTHAIRVFIVNQTSILALSEEGNLYRMQVTEDAQAMWEELTPTSDRSSNNEAEQSSPILMKSGVISHEGGRIYFCTEHGSLFELNEIDPPRWVDHGRPPGGNVAAIAAAGTIRPEVVYTISSTGDLYEYDRNSKPSWKKHIWTEGKREDVSLLPSVGSTLRGVNGDHSISLYLLTKSGKLVERRLYQRKWKWMVHGSPNCCQLTSITPVLHDDSNENSFCLFLTTSAGSVFEYRIPKHFGSAQDKQSSAWTSHMHPQHAKVARAIPALQLQVGRILFALDDGRLAELHLPSLGGETTGPNQQVNFRRKTSIKYVWSMLDAPETEGWNAEYCKEERGPMNCITGIKDEPKDIETIRSTTRRRKSNQAQEYLPLDSNCLKEKAKEHNLPNNWIDNNFRLRLMHEGRSFFLVTDGGLTYEYLHTEDVWLWLRHDHSTPMKGALGNYNGSLFLVDVHGSLLIRERSSDELAWINCTAMRKGKQVIAGPPWEGIPGKPTKVTPEDALFFVSKNGRLLQFTVALRKFKWKDCGRPPNTKVGSIIDQELFRENIIFVVGRNGRLFQYNKVTELWHQHYQSQHLILSRMPGTAIRPSPLTLTGSLFMLSEDGGLVEYQWISGEGWNWIEHGKPNKDVTLVTSPIPCIDGSQLFSIGSNGKVYMRYADQSTWRWRNLGFPVEGRTSKDKDHQGVCVDEDSAGGIENNVEDAERNCNTKVASTRPIPFTEDSIIFEQRDGRMAELTRVEGEWKWSRTIGTPTSLCAANYWTADAS